MVKVPAGVVIFCGILLLVQPSLSVIRQLNTINDLKEISFGESVFKQVLVLLHWFANTVNINNHVIRLTFDPNNDFGSHHYGNYEGLLNIRLNNRHHYYTVGNIHKETNRQLPSHILNPRSSDLRGNSARIIFRVCMRNVASQRNNQVIDEVYITQHHGQGMEYDPQHTYRITNNLLRQMRQFPMRADYNSMRNLRDLYRANVDDDQLWDIQHQWNDLACLGLLLLIVVPYTSIHFSNQSHTVPASSTLQGPSTQTAISTLCDSIKCCLGIVLIILVILCFLIMYLNKY